LIWTLNWGNLTITWGQCHWMLNKRTLYWETLNGGSTVFIAVGVLPFESSTKKISFICTNSESFLNKVDHVTLSISLLPGTSSDLCWEKGV
jgi:hypothetical protein